MVEQLLIDYTDPDVVKRQNVHPNVGCEIDGQFVDIRNLLHIVAELDAENARLRKRNEYLEDRNEECEHWRIHWKTKAFEALSRTGAVKVTEAMIEAGLEYYAEGGCGGLADYERREVVEAIIEAALKAAMEAGR